MYCLLLNITSERVTLQDWIRRRCTRIPSNGAMRRVKAGHWSTRRSCRRVFARETRSEIACQLKVTAESTLSNRLWNARNFTYAFFKKKRHPIVDTTWMAWNDKLSKNIQWRAAEIWWAFLYARGQFIYCIHLNPYKWRAERKKFGVVAPSIHNLRGTENKYYWKPRIKQFTRDIENHPN